MGLSRGMASADDAHLLLFLRLLHLTQLSSKLQLLQLPRLVRLKCDVQHISWQRFGAAGRLDRSMSPCCGTKESAVSHLRRALGQLVEESPQVLSCGCLSVGSDTESAMDAVCDRWWWWVSRAKGLMQRC